MKVKSKGFGGRDIKKKFVHPDGLEHTAWKGGGGKDTHNI